MPSINDAQQADLTGYKPVDPLPVLPALVKNTPSSDVFNRCPLPPFNIDPDTLRQFEVTGSGVPQLRVIPLPIQTGGTSTTTFVGNSSSSSSSGGSSTVVTPTITIKSAMFTTGGIPVGNWVLGTITLSRSFQLATISVNNPCEVRLYGSSLTQTIDSSRPVDAPVPAEITQGLIADVIFDTAPFTWGFQNTVGCNQSAPQTTTAFITVLNSGNTALPGVQVSVAYVPLET
jgi:hypothetical protein